MHAYWDASAALALIFREPHTAVALRAQEECTSAVAWSWGRVEIEAGIARRGGPRFDRAGVDAMLSRMSWMELGNADWPAVIELNKRHGLRAADVGHLYCMRRLSRLDPALTLVCFDEELVRAARREKLRVWSG